MFDIPVTVRATGSVDTEQAWDRYATPQRWPQWAPQIVAVRCAEETIRPGLTGTVVGIGGLTVAFAIDDVDPVLRRWSWTVRLGPIRLRLHHELAEIPSGTATVLRIIGPAPVVLPYAPIARLALGRLVRP